MAPLPQTASVVHSAAAFVHSEVGTANHALDILLIILGIVVLIAWGTVLTMYLVYRRPSSSEAQETGDIAQSSLTSINPEAHGQPTELEDIKQLPLDTVRSLGVSSRGASVFKRLFSFRKVRPLMDSICAFDDKPAQKNVAQRVSTGCAPKAVSDIESQDVLVIQRQDNVDLPARQIPPPPKCPASTPEADMSGIEQASDATDAADDLPSDTTDDQLSSSGSFHTSISLFLDALKTGDPDVIAAAREKFTPTDPINMCGCGCGGKPSVLPQLTREANSPVSHIDELYRAYWAPTIAQWEADMERAERELMQKLAPIFAVPKVESELCDEYLDESASMYSADSVDDSGYQSEPSQTQIASNYILSFCDKLGDQTTPEAVSFPIPEISIESCDSGSSVSEASWMPLERSLHDLRSSSVDHLEVPAMSWTAPNSTEKSRLKPALPLMDISNISNKTFILGVPPRRGRRNTVVYAAPKGTSS
ncbi:uncharacterized protein FIBRA_00896 [Fibroporia radiculosa]|uniref:Uncharacterized protein n=1 Tax=Fibroporia radiculosa TaxID=599839 RepID=J4H0T1_9APHY|nr:uncharacterized protein FIBRA_00896 [Fibroporia radiculosa]CCL98889.1 predicted protein [Fibroporia radiculosa]